MFYDVLHSVAKLTNTFKKYFSSFVEIYFLESKVPTQLSHSFVILFFVLKQPNAVLNHMIYDHIGFTDC